MIVKGSLGVFINGMPAARVGDMTSHAACVAPIPSPVGTILPPGCPTVLIGDAGGVGSPATQTAGKTPSSTGKDSSVDPQRDAIKALHPELLAPILAVGLEGGVLAGARALGSLISRKLTSEGVSEISNVNPEFVTSTGTEVKMSSRVRSQLKARGWSDEDIQDTLSGPPAGTTRDSRSANKSDDGLKRNDPASVFGNKDQHIIINDKTGEVVQGTDKGGAEGWIPDSRIKWNDEP